MTQYDNAGWALHYRAHLPPGIGVVTAVVLASAMFPLYLLTSRAGVPSFLATPVMATVPVLITNVLLRRDVVLSGDGRLTVTGLGQRIDVDVRSFTEITVSAGARMGFGFARIRWNGGGFRIWQAMTYIPAPRRKWRKGGSYGSVTQDFRDLVYRLYLINPTMRIRGVTPPAWALPTAMPGHPHPIAGRRWP